MIETLAFLSKYLSFILLVIAVVYAFSIYKIHKHPYWVWMGFALIAASLAVVDCFFTTLGISMPPSLYHVLIPALLGGVLFLIAIRKMIASIAPSAAAAGGEEMSFLRDDILAVRSYATLTNTFLATVKHAAGDKLLKDVLTKHFEYNPLLFEGCEIKDDGTVNTEPIVENLDRIHKENRVQLVCSMFSTLNTKIMNLYGAVTSPDMAKKALGVSYLTVKKQYSDLPVFFDILRSLPEGVLEEARISLLSRDELEVRVRERTAELEKAYKELKKKVEAKAAEKKEG